MTLTKPFLVNGAVHPASTVRGMTKSLARGNEGIAAGPDLKVRQLATPGTQVRVGDGAAFLLGKTSPSSQGTYHVTNVGDELVGIAATGSSARTDLVVLRIEDPEYEGTLNPATDLTGYITVVSGVSSTATTVPNSSWTAIPLARVTVPANTATITDAMITSIRACANPRRERNLYIVNHSGAVADLTSSSFTLWPSSASWTVSVPTWASQMKLLGEVAGAKLMTSSFTGAFRAGLGSSITTQSITLDFDAPSGAYRVYPKMGDTASIPASYRGTDQTLVIGAMRSSGTGVLRADTGTASIIDLEFVETPI